MKTEVSFVLWLYATVSIRDEVTGSSCSEEVHWCEYYLHVQLRQRLTSFTNV
jgi:hypothetical protein